MTIQECYEKMGGDLNDVMSRLMTEQRVAKFMLRFPADPSYNGLIASLDEQKYEDAFRFAHTIKGVAQNLGFQKLYLSVNELTEALRPTHELPAREVILSLLEPVKADYQKTIDTIAAFQSEM